MAYWAYNNSNMAHTTLEERAPSVSHPEKMNNIDQKLRNMIQRELQKYQSKNNNLYQQFEQELSAAVEQEFNYAQREIPQTVGELTTFYACNKLAYKLAKDELMGTNDAQEAIEPSLNRILSHCASGAARAENVFQNYSVRLNENFMEFSANLAAEAQENGYDEYDQEALTRFAEDIYRANEAVINISKSTILAEVGATLEVVFIRTTYTMISSVLAKVVAKLAGSATATGICAVADGPLPIGDIIGAGVGVVGLVWTSYDLYQAQAVLPGKLTEMLQESVQNYRISVLNSARDRAKKALESGENNGQKLVQKINSANNL